MTCDGMALAQAAGTAQTPPGDTVAIQSNTAMAHTFSSKHTTPHVTKAHRNRDGLCDTMTIAVMIMPSEASQRSTISLAVIPGTGCKAAAIPSAATEAPKPPTMFPTLVRRSWTTMVDESHAAPVPASAIAVKSH